LTSPSTWVAGDFGRLAAAGTPLLRHRSITHLVVVVTALAVAVLFAIPNAPIIKAGLITAPQVESILPANVGVGIASADGVVLNFPGPMDRDAVRAALRLTPRTDVTFLWNADSTTLALVPTVRWATDQRYVIHVPAGTALADRRQLAADWRASFTTQTAPRVVALAVTEVSGTPSADIPTVVQQVLASSGDRDAGSSAPDDVAPDASAATGIGLTFSAAMDHTATENAFLITPSVPGAFEWQGTTLWFAPDQRLVPGVRYAISVAGARDADGIRVGGDTSFSFATRPSAQAMAVSPAIWASGVTGQTVTIEFSQPMDRDATAAAFSLADTISGQLVAGQIAWSADSRSLTFSTEGGFTPGHEYVATLGAGARDADGNPVSISWRFAAAAPARTYTYSPVPASPGSSDMVQYALNQLNSARASYGIAPLALDAALTAVAYGHAADMLANGYFGHDSLDGTTYKQRLTNAGISYGWSGENACYLGYGGGVQATLDWCHSGFWSEPYPGGGNHKDNILNTNYRRVGIGIATGANKVYVVWDFTD
jgi:uncharacterized protein YkwD